MTKLRLLSFTFAFAGGIIYTGGKEVWKIGKAMIDYFVGANRDVCTKSVGTGVLDGPQKTITFPKFSVIPRCFRQTKPPLTQGSLIFGLLSIFF